MKHMSLLKGTHGITVEQRTENAIRVQHTRKLRGLQANAMGIHGDYSGKELWNSRGGQGGKPGFAMAESRGTAQRKFIANDKGHAA